MSTAEGRADYYRFLLQHLAPDEVELVGEYQRALEIGASEPSKLGPEFGITEGAIAAGPLVVLLGKFLLDVGSTWLATVAQKTVEGYVVDKGKARLKAWLDAPAKEKLDSVLTDKGKAQIIVEVARLAAASNLPRDDVDQALARIISLVTGTGE